MPSWKKVIVSGSDANLNSLSVTTSVTAASLTGSLQTDTIQFTAQVIENAVEGQLGYSFDNGKLTFYTENNTPIELGRSTYIRVRNDEVDTLTKGTIVDFTATSTGQTPRVKRAIATDGVDCSCFVGVVIQDIPTTEFGYIILNGVLDGLDLSTFDNGDQVYLSQTVSGSFTTSIPTPPVKAIRIGAVLNASNSPTQGVLFVRPENRTVIFDLANFKETYNTGSFSGSFVGDGSGLTGISTAEDTFPFTGSAVISGSLEVTGSIFSNIFLNPQTITDDIIIPDGYNGIILGPVDLQGNVTVGSGSNLIVFEDFLTTVKLTEENEFTAVQTFSPSINIVSSSYGYGEVEDVTDEIQTVSSVDAEEYKAAFFDYVISDGTNFRAGTITSVWDYINTLISQTEVSTTDIGDTTNVTLNVILDGNLAKLQAETTGSGWDIQTLVRTL
jgi:hypothetical protein